MRRFKMKIEAYRRQWDLVDSRSAFQRLWQFVDARAEPIILAALLIGTLLIVLDNVFK